MAKNPTHKKMVKPEAFTPEPDAWTRFERATDAVVKAAAKEKAKRKPARIVRKKKPAK